MMSAIVRFFVNRLEHPTVYVMKEITPKKFVCELKS